MQDSFGVCLGNGDGTFRAGSLVSLVGTLTNLAVLDFNSDGIQVSDSSHSIHRACSLIQFMQQ